MKRVLSLLLVAATLGWPLTGGSSSFDESLRDDVFAMVSTTQILNTTFLLDTSEGMNSFAYSSYVTTCTDSIQKIDKAEDLCLQAYQDCVNTANSLSCGGGDIMDDCITLKQRCDNLTLQKASLTAYCYDGTTGVSTLYAEPGQAETQAWDHAKSLKYVGPWNPNKMYNIDLCFYDWTADSGFDIPNNDPGSYSQYPNKPATPDGPDRRDWTCVSSNYGLVTRSGLWLNWKYTTALDAIKIILADEHEFAITPRKRGETFTCYDKEWVPTDSFGNDECFQSFDTVAAEGDALVESMVRTRWKVASQTEIIGITDMATCLNPASVFKAVNPPPAPREHDSAGCSSCWDQHGDEVTCSGESQANFETNLDPVTVNMEVTNTLVCCKVFHCATPKCRNDINCDGDGNPCPLGYYSEWDQDPNHCCDALTCAEGGGTGCAQGSYIPGPGESYMESYEDDFVMSPLDAGIGEYYTLAELTTDTSIDLTITPLTANARLTLYAGCQGELTSSVIYQQDFTASTTMTLPAAIPMAGCDDKGYRLKVELTVTHTGTANGDATATLVFVPELSYYKNGYFSIQVLNESGVFYRGRSWEPKGSGGPLQVVSEYECKHTFYSSKTKTVNNETQCNTPQCDLAGGCKVYPDCLADNTCYVPYTRDGVNRDPLLCKFKNFQSVGSGKYNCLWVCPDAPQYDDTWKCMEFFEQLDPNPSSFTALSLFSPAQVKLNGGPGEANVHCDYQSGDSVYRCCSDTNTYYGNYLHFTGGTPTYFENLNDATQKGSFRCGWSGFQVKTYCDSYNQWGDCTGERTIIIGGEESEIVTGHIQEVAGGSYLLNSIGGTYFEGYSTPYADVNKWYSSKSLINYGKSTIASSFVSLFKTTPVTQRMTACMYDIAADMYGQDCDDCGLGCCPIDMSTINYCDFPTFWSKVAQSDGGTLVMPPKNLIGQKLNDYKDIVKNLKGVGGAALGETLYDVWRYLGGLKPAYGDLALYPQGYASPIETDPACFNNTVILVSGGQPTFDSNSHMDGVDLNGTPPGAGEPYVQEDATDWPTDGKPYTISNWFLSALPQVAGFVHTQDAFIGDIACRANPATYRFGFTGTCASNDTTGTNIINRLDTVGIGNWGLAALYAKIAGGNTTGYLDTNTLSDAATNGGGNFFSLTTENPDGSTSFSNLTDIFNQFTQTHTGLRSLGRAHWTSSPIQPIGSTGIADQNLAFIPAAVPVSNKVSRFWFGNLRKYYIKEKEGVDCILGETPVPDSDSDPCTTEPIPQTDFLDDCFDPTSLNTVTATNAASDTNFEVVLNGGLRTKLAAQLQACSTWPCFANTTTGRKILYDDTLSNLMKDFEAFDNSNTLLLKQMFGVSAANDARKIIDYVYGYDSVDHDNDTNLLEKRSSLTALTTDIGDPYDSIDTPAGWKVSTPYSILGAIVHNEPIVVFYGPKSGDTPYMQKNLRIYLGANDGLMHAFDGLGAEKWAYMPSKIMKKMQFILSDLDTVVFNSTIDGPSTIFHIDDGAGVPANLNNGVIDNNEKAFLIFGYRRGIDISGGSSYYTVINITDRDTPTFVQHIPVEGQSWSKPTVFRKGANYYLAFAGGYDPCYDNATPSCPSPKGAKIYIYQYDSINKDFDHVKTFSRLDTDDHLKWLVAPVVAEALAVNTKNYLFYDNGSAYLGDTEYLYFVDLTGTVFRVEPLTWTLTVALTHRAIPGVPGTPDFTPGIRTYHMLTVYPPYNPYPYFQIDANGDGDLTDQEDVYIAPLPIQDGNKVTIKEQGLQYEMYTPWALFPNEPYFGTLADTSIPQFPTNFVDKTDGADSFTYATTTRGWYVSYDASVHEKGTTAPLVLTTYQGQTRNWVTWTTYQPDAVANQCANSGSAFQYLRTVDTGIIPPDYTCEKYEFTEGGLAAAPRVVYGGKHADDENILAAAGANIYSVEAMETAPATQTIRILKWYELY